MRICIAKAFFLCLAVSTNFCIDNVSIHAKLKAIGFVLSLPT
jgi:hypothetical protein